MSTGRATPKVATSKSGWFIAHAWIADQANYFLQAAEDPTRPDGRISNCAAALAFGSFCLEAFFNTAGRIWVPDWDLRERKLSPSEKLTVLGTAMGINVDAQKPPFTCVSALFKYRNWLAHGTDERVRSRVISKEGAQQAAIWGAPLHAQQQLLEPVTTRKYLSQADALIDMLKQRSRRRHRPIPSNTTWVATHKRIGHEQPGA
jgi:hypothetical protein